MHSRKGLDLKPVQREKVGFVLGSSSCLVLAQDETHRIRFLLWDPCPNLRAPYQISMRAPG